MSLVIFLPQKGSQLPPFNKLQIQRNVKNLEYQMVVKIFMALIYFLKSVFPLKTPTAYSYKSYIPETRSLGCV